MKKKWLLLCTLSLFSTVALFGCKSKENDLSQYKESVEDFYSIINTADQNINAIDPESEDASSQLLTELDKLDIAFQDFSKLTVPEEFSGIETLAEDASANMSEAVSLYHTAFEGEEFNEFTVSLASDKYERAMKRIDYIGQILQGQVPEGDDISVYYEDSTSEVE